VAAVEIDADVSRLREALDRIAAQAGMYGRKIADAFNRGIAPLAEARGQLGRFGEVAKSLNANPVISQVESLSSLLIPLGGNMSRVGMTFATAARPVAVMSALMGEMPPALIGAATAAGALTVGVGAMGLAISVAGNQAVEAAGKVTDLVEELEKSARGGSLEARHELERYADQVLAIKALQELHADTLKEQNRLLLAGADATAKQAAGWESLGVSIKGSWESFKANVGINVFLAKLGNDDVENLKAQAEFVDILTQSREKLNITKEAAAALEAKGKADADADAAARARSIALAERQLKLEQDLVANQIDLPDRSAFVITSDEIEDNWAVERAAAIEQFQLEAQLSMERRALWEQEVQARKAMSAAVMQAVQGSMDGISALVEFSTEQTISTYEEMIRAGDDLSAADESRYKRALAARKVAAVAEILTNAAVAYAGMVANLAPALGAAAPGLAAVIVGTSVIAPMTQIIGESIPWSVGGASAEGTAAPEWVDKVFNPNPDSQSGFERAYNSVFGRGGADDNGDGDVTDAERNNAAGGGGSTRRSSRGATVMVAIDPRTQSLRVEQAAPGKVWRRQG
jgi:hypothetical protein